jgi:hypothetical protein
MLVRRVPMLDELAAESVATDSEINIELAYAWVVAAAGDFFAIHGVSAGAVAELERAVVIEREDIAIWSAAFPASDGPASDHGRVVAAAASAAIAAAIATAAMFAAREESKCENCRESGEERAQFFRHELLNG